jgi:DNA gyrase subunit A
VVTITHNGYIKRLPTATWRAQRRGGKGMKGAKTKEDDYVEHLLIASTHNTMLFFTNKGKCHWLKVHQIPPGSRISQGRAIINLINCEQGEKVQAFVSVKEFNDTDHIVMATKKGMIKRSCLNLYSKPRKGGIYAIEVREGDELIQARVSSGDQDIIMATSGGKAIRFAESAIRATGRKTMGVRGVKMSFPEDYVVGMLVVKREGTVLVATNKGYGKRSDVDEYRTQNRGGKGVYTVKSTPKVGKLVSIMEVIDDDDIMIITNKGIMIRQPVQSIKVIGRNTQGVKLLRLDDGAFISSITKVLKEEERDETSQDLEEENNKN